VENQSLLDLAFQNVNTYGMVLVLAGIFFARKKIINRILSKICSMARSIPIGEKKNYMNDR
jgi:hypothetical protein